MNFLPRKKLTLESRYPNLPHSKIGVFSAPTNFRLRLYELRITLVYLFPCLLVYSIYGVI